MPREIQSLTELERFYQEPDPWGYDTTPDDAARRARLLAQLPTLPYKRVLDIGCGNAFVTAYLPGDVVVGCDLSTNAIHWACRRVGLRPDIGRFNFRVGSIFDLRSDEHGHFDLIVITGVLYPQYIGQGFSLVREIVDDLLLPGGILISCHIADWSPWRFPYAMISADLSPYREYIHRVEAFVK